MANNRMWLVNDLLRVRVLLAKHDGEAWCWCNREPDMPYDARVEMAWRIAFDSDVWTDYANLATPDGLDGYARSPETKKGAEAPWG